MIGGGLDANWWSNTSRSRLQNSDAGWSVRRSGTGCNLRRLGPCRHEQTRRIADLVLEALVHETPIVIPDEVGCMEAAAQGRFAEVYAKESIEDLRRATLHVLNRPDHRDRHVNG